MSCSVNPSIKTQVSAASEPPYHEERTLNSRMPIASASRTATRQNPFWQYPRTSQPTPILRALTLS